LPALTLYNMSSFEILYVKPPSYSNFHPFGCLVFPYLWDYAPHKLNLCSCSCVLFGYNMSHHGFHYLDRLTNQVFTFRHAIFYEHKYPFSELAYSRSLFSFLVNAFLEPILIITTDSEVHSSQQHNSLLLPCRSCLTNTCTSFVPPSILQDSITNPSLAHEQDFRSSS
jgi:hypothetical protein